MIKRDILLLYIEKNKTYLYNLTTKKEFTCYTPNSLFYYNGSIINVKEYRKNIIILIENSKILKNILSPVLYILYDSSIKVDNEYLFTSPLMDSGFKSIIGISFQEILKDNRLYKKLVLKIDNYYIDVQENKRINRYNKNKIYVNDANLEVKRINDKDYLWKKFKEYFALK